MKKYNVNVKVIKEMIFEVEAEGKREAVRKVKDIINTSSITDCKIIKNKNIIYDVKEDNND